MQLDTFSTVTSSPFRMTVGLQEVFAHVSWARARFNILDVAAQGGRVVLVGEPGTGKTLLLRELGRSLRGQSLCIRRLRTGETLPELAAAEIVLVDEADLFASDELERICRLPNALVMAGLPSLIERLPPGCRPFQCERLEPLQPQDIARFVRSRLAASDPTHPAFTAEAVLALMQHSAGLFRLVTILAGAASFFARQRGSSEVDVADVHDAASLRASAFETEEAEAAPEALVPAEADQSESGATRWQRRRRTLAGWTSWGGASLAVVVVAIMAARTLQPPRFGLQEAEARPSPVLLAAAAPDLPLAAPVPVAAPSSAQVLTPPPPTVAHPPPPEPIARSEAMRAEAGAPPVQQAPSETELPPSVVAFGGQIVNETMGQGGQLSLKLMTSAPGRSVGALFHASHGLIGTGTLNGAIEPSGKVSLTGRLMMGRNPFDCTLYATLEGDRLVGEAIFIRPTTGSVAHSRFSLSRL